MSERRAPVRSTPDTSESQSPSQRELIRSHMKMVIDQLEGILKELKDVARELREVRRADSPVLSPHACACL